MDKDTKIMGLSDYTREYEKCYVDPCTVVILKPLD